MADIETFGEVLPEIVMEAVADPNHPGELLLHTYNGRDTSTVQRAEHHGFSYIPKKLTPGLMQAVHFARPSSPSASSSELVSSLQDLLSRYAHLRDVSRTVLAAFILASWFSDGLPVAPVLYVLGPSIEVSQVLRLLACFSRRSILLSDIDLGSLAALPDGLGVTLLVNQRMLGRSVKRALLASNRRHFCLIRGGRRLDLYGPKAFACDGVVADEPGLRISLSPSPNPLLFLTDAEQEQIAQKFQSELLRYRMENVERVRTTQVDTRAFIATMREQAHAWLAPICDFPELSESVSAEILRQTQELGGLPFVDHKCLVIEAALFFCHSQNQEHFFVGELADYVNVLLEGRNEKADMSAKKAGLVLSELGVHTAPRVAKGCRVLLDDITRRHIHQLASDYKVLSLQDGVSRCGDCRSSGVLSLYS